MCVCVCVCVCVREREKETQRHQQREIKRKKEAEREGEGRGKERQRLPFAYSGFFASIKGTSNHTSCRSGKDNGYLVLSTFHFASLEPRIL